MGEDAEATRRITLQRRPAGMDEALILQRLRLQGCGHGKRLLLLLGSSSTKLERRRRGLELGSTDGLLHQTTCSTRAFWRTCVLHGEGFSTAAGRTTIQSSNIPRAPPSFHAQSLPAALLLLAVRNQRIIES